MTWRRLGVAMTVIGVVACWVALLYYAYLTRWQFGYYQ